MASDLEPGAPEDTPATWPMWALVREDPPPGAPSLWAIDAWRRYAVLHGGTPVPVTATVDPDGDFLGWVTALRPVPHMIQPKRLFNIQFPYGYRAEEELGKGRAVPLRVELDDTDRSTP